MDWQSTHTQLDIHFRGLGKQQRTPLDSVPMTMMLPLVTWIFFHADSAAYRRKKQMT